MRMSYSGRGECRRRARDLRGANRRGENGDETTQGRQVRLSLRALVRGWRGLKRTLLWMHREADRRLTGPRLALG